MFIKICKRKQIRKKENSRLFEHWCPIELRRACARRSVLASLAARLFATQNFNQKLSYQKGKRFSNDLTNWLVKLFIYYF